MIPYEKYPGLSPLFLDFLRGLPEFYADPPSLDAAQGRARELLAAKVRARVPPSAFRFRSAEAARLADELAAGRAVAVSAGHQVGLFSGPLFTLVKALDAIRLARELSRGGIPAAPVFWALTDDHDLQEVARTARPGPEGPQILVLEGADRQNRQPVGSLAIPERIREIVDAFGPDAEAGATAAILQEFARRSSPGTSYGDAFVETLLDLVDPDPLLILDPLREELRDPTREFFLAAARKEKELRATLRETEEKLRRAGKAIPAPVPDGFSFFAIDRDGRRRIEDLPSAVARVEAGEIWPSADVLMRPVLKSFLLPLATSVLGAAEIAYHAQSLPLYGLFGLKPPVLIPRHFVVLRGPTERRLVEALGIAEEDLLTAAADPQKPVVPEADAVAAAAQTAAGALDTLTAPLEKLDASLVGSLETTRRKIAYQFKQLAERARKSAERRQDVDASRRRRLALLLTPNGVPAERLYPPLVPMLAYGRRFGEALRAALDGSAERGGVVVDLGLPEEPKGESRAG